MSNDMGNLFDIGQTVQAAGPRLQDRVIVLPNEDGAVLAVADGAGGSGGGTEAATEFAELARARAAELTDEKACVRLLRDADLAISRAGHGGETTGVVVVVARRKTFGASVGDSAAWWMNSHQAEELTAGQKRRPFLGTGNATPVAFKHHFALGSLVLATDGLWKFTNLQRVREQVIGQTPAEAAQNLVRLVTFPSGTLPDDVGVIVCHRLKDPKPAIYLTDPAEMRRVRMNQPRMTLEQAELQRQALHAAAEEFFAEAALRSANDRGAAQP